ncbi:MAG TPA: hypothetical protein PLV93_03535 [Microthrixaceae bacterium]|nr:hypothetical protein [Microthrixaceae bacterium]
MTGDASKSPERPGHPTRQAVILLVVVTLLIVGLAVMSTFG